MNVAFLSEQYICFQDLLKKKKKKYDIVYGSMKIFFFHVLSYLEILFMILYESMTNKDV